MFFHTLWYQKQQSSEGDIIKDIMGVPVCQYSILTVFINKVCYNGALICITISCYKTVESPDFQGARSLSEQPPDQ